MQHAGRPLCNYSCMLAPSRKLHALHPVRNYRCTNPHALGFLSFVTFTFYFLTVGTTSTLIQPFSLKISISCTPAQGAPRAQQHQFMFLPWLWNVQTKKNAHGQRSARPEHVVVRSEPARAPLPCPPPQVSSIIVGCLPSSAHQALFPINTPSRRLRSQ